MNLTTEGAELLNDAEQRLSRNRYRCVWQKIDKRQPFDSVWSLWINMTTGRGFLLSLTCVEETINRLAIYELNETELEKI